MNTLVTITDQKAVTTSLIVAEAFEKQHKNVMRDIGKLECSAEFNRLNFEPVGYTDAKGELRPMFNITRDGFTFLAMGFTGKRAAEFKEKFITAFNEMERALLEGQGDFRQVDVNLRHTRGITNPHGLDIQCRLDLTKLCIHPTHEGLEILQRLTGIDMSGIVVPARAGSHAYISRWVEEECIESREATITAREAYQSFRGWWAVNFSDDPPSQKRFGDAMTRRFARDRNAPGGTCRYLGLELRTDSRQISGTALSERSS